MTIKIGTGSSASELTSIRVGTGSSNAEVQRVMVGTGTSAVEVWSSSPYPLSGTVVTDPGGSTDVLNHTVAESGTFTFAATSTGGSSPFAEMYLFKDGELVARSGLMANPAITRTFTVAAGQVLYSRVSPDGRSLTVTWSLTKN